MMRFVASILLAMVASIAIAAASKPPAPSAGEKTRPAQQEAPQNQNRSAAPEGEREGDSFLISVEASGAAQADREQDAKEREEHAANERGLTYWTWALAICTGALALIAAIQAGLFVWQLRVMKASLVDSGNAARAAMSSSRAFRRTERPWVLMDKFLLRGAPFYKPESFWQSDDARNVVAKPPIVKFNWKNAGRSPAFLLGMKQKFFVMEPNENLAAHWTLSDAADFDHEHAMIPDGSYGRPIHFSTGLIQQVTWQKILSGELLLIFAAFVRYRDPFGAEHETAFCAKFSGLPKRPSWYQDFGGKEYNYQT